MKKFLRPVSVLFLCGVLFNSALAQQSITDSLQMLVKKDKEDTSKVNHLNMLGRKVMYSNPDTTIILCNQALALAKKLEWKRGISNSLANIGYSYSLLGNYSKALECNFNALKIAEVLNDKNNLANCLGNIGLVYYHKGDYLKALDYYFKALKIAEEFGDKNAITRHLCNIGIVYYLQEDFPKALDYFHKSLKIAEEQGNKQYQANNIGNIGSIYLKQHNYPKALDYFFKDLKLQQDLGIKDGEAMALGNIGIVYSMQGDYPKALDYQLQALKMREELGDKNGIAETLGNIGRGYTLTGKFKEAESYLKKAIALDNSIGNLNDSRQFEESLSVLYDTTAQMAVRNRQFAIAAEKYKLSLMHYKKAITLKDSLFSQEKNDEITRKEMNYEFDKKEAATKAEHDKQLAVADVEIKKQKLLKNFLTGGLALLLILSFFIYNNFRIVNKLKLQNIRNRIASDLHDDVGSTLNSISVYSEVAKQKSPAVVDELEQIGDASRKIIEVMSDIVWTINPKNDTFENIISRMGTLAYNLLKAKNIEHTFNADENLNETKLTLESRRNFYLIFKEALNNLVKYSNATRASITLKKENGLIILALRDNGVGFDVAQTSKGNGLLNMKGRAAEMKAQLKIESEKGSGTNVELIFKA